MGKKGENIYKRKDGRWEARYIKGYAADGKAKYGYCYGKTYSSAKEKAGASRSSILIHTPSAKAYAKTRVSDYCDDWLRLKRSRVRESTYVKYGMIIENHIKPSVGGLSVALLSSLAIEQFSYDLLHKKGLSAKTVKDVLTVLRSVMKYIEKQLPSFRSAEVICPKEEKKEMRVLSREEQRSFTEYLLTDIDPCKFGTLLTMLTGLRIGEICALRWSNVLLADGIICVKSTMQRISNRSTADIGFEYGGKSECESKKRYNVKEEHGAMGEYGVGYVYDTEYENGIRNECDAVNESVSKDVHDAQSRRDGNGGDNVKDRHICKTRIIISDPKSSASARIIPLSPLAGELCRRFAVYPDDAYILTGKSDRYMEPRTLQYRMKRYAEECGLDGVHFHTLRHSFATRCVEVGVELKSLSEILGHSSPKITIERYVHSSIELKRENINKLAAIGY